MNTTIRGGMQFTLILAMLALTSFRGRAATASNSAPTSGNVGGGFPKVDGNVAKKDRVLIYVDSNDIEADLKKVEAAGGKTLHGKEEIPGWGWWAMFSDPTGNSLGLYQKLPK